MKNGLEKLNLTDYKPLREVVFETLRNAIVKGNLKPGERLMEIQLAEKLGVSRTPVREAIRKLELEGLVVMVPRKGAYVADVSLKDILDVLEIRSYLEGLAAFLAAQRITEKESKKLEKKLAEFRKCFEDENLNCLVQKDIELHDVIFNASKNERLTALVDGLREQVQRFRITYIMNYNKGDSIMEQHEKIVGAILSGECEEARKQAQEHIETARDYIIEHSKDKLDPDDIWE